MGEFRIGRKHAQHSYPDTRAAMTVPFARNFASGPDTTPFIDNISGTQVPWSTVDVPGPSTTDVPITPKSTGRVRVTGVFTIANTGETPATVQVQAQLNAFAGPTSGTNLPVPFEEQVTIPANSSAAVPLLAETTPAQTPVGVRSFIEILLTADAPSALVIVIESSTLDLQEVSVSSG